MLQFLHELFLLTFSSCGLDHQSDYKVLGSSLQKERAEQYQRCVLGIRMGWGNSEHAHCYFDFEFSARALPLRAFSCFYFRTCRYDARTIRHGCGPEKGRNAGTVLYERCFAFKRG